MSFEDALLGADAVYMDGAITALRSDVFVHGIPRHSLDVVIVFRYFSDAFPCEVFSPEEMSPMNDASYHQ